MNIRGVSRWFGDFKGLPRINTLVHGLEQGLPVNVQPGRDWVNAMSDGNHSAVNADQDNMYEQLRLDVMNGRAFVFNVRPIFGVKLIRVSHLWWWCALNFVSYMTLLSTLSNAAHEY